MGPDDSKHNAPFANSAMRYFNDLTVIWKATDKLTLSGEANYVREGGFNTQAWGVVGYAGYTVSDTITLNERAEFFKDNKNFFVSNLKWNLDFINGIRGVPANFYTATKPTTYSEFTAGFTYKPTWLPSTLSTAMLRPELRYDYALNNSKPFNNGTQRGAFTLAADVVPGF